MLEGNSDGGDAKIWPTGLSDEVTIHQVGKMNGTHSTHISPYSAVLRLMEDPPPPKAPLEQREQKDDREQQHREGRPVAELVELEGLLVQVVDEHRGRRARSALGEDRDLGEVLQRADHGDDRGEQQC